MVGIWVDKFGHSNMCPHCGMVEDEFHAFVHCDIVQPILLWFKNIITKAYPSLLLNDLHDWHWLLGYNNYISNTKIKPWKLLHAETIRGIWYARTQKLFEDKNIGFQEIVALIK
jgi:hypothetical protein